MSLVPAPTSGTQTSAMLPTPNWHATHAEAEHRLTLLSEALAAGDWNAVDQGARWIYEVLRPHNEAEERELFPLLEEIGAEALHQRLFDDHRQMWEMTLHLLVDIVDAPAWITDRYLRLLGRRPTPAELEASGQVLLDAQGGPELVVFALLTGPEYACR